MYNLNNLLSAEIKEKLRRKNLNLILALSAKDCDGRWPRCRVLINDKIIFDDEVQANTNILFNNEFDTVDTTAIIAIHRYGKTIDDIKIDTDGNIIDNQMLQITKLILNGVDIMKNNMIYQGKFIMHLSDEQVKYFKNNDIPAENHDYHFYENGKWTLQIGLPVLTYIINSIKQTETFEKIPYDDIMMAIIKKLEM